VPKQWMRTYFNDLACAFARILICSITVLFKVVKTHRNNTTRFGIFDLEMAFIKAILKPVISVELAYQVSLRIY
jgi:hypothetical protein